MSQCILVHGHKGGYRHLHVAGILPTQAPYAEISLREKGIIGPFCYCVELNDEGAWISLIQLREDAEDGQRIGYLQFSIFVNSGTHIPHIKEALDRLLDTYILRTGDERKAVIEPTSWAFVDQLTSMLEEKEDGQNLIWIPSERSETAKMYIPNTQIEPFLIDLSLGHYSLYKRVFIVPQEFEDKEQDPLHSILGEKLPLTPAISREMEFELQEHINQKKNPKPAKRTEDTISVPISFSLGKSRYVHPGRTDFRCSNPQVHYNAVTQVLSYPKSADVRGFNISFNFAESYRPSNYYYNGEDSINIELHYSIKGKLLYYKPLLIGIAVILVLLIGIILFKKLEIPQAQPIPATKERPEVVVDDPEHPINADDKPGPKDTVGWAIKYAKDYLATDKWNEDSLQKHYNILSHYDKQSLLDASQQSVKEIVRANLLFRHAINNNMLTKGENCMKDLLNYEKFPHLARQLGDEKYQFLNDISQSADLQKRLRTRRGDIINASYPKVREILYGKKANSAK